jgi:hypothetical protein
MRIYNLRTVLISIATICSIATASAILPKMRTRRPASSVIFQCSGTSEEWAARLIVTDDGTFEMDAQKGSTQFSCTLGLREFIFNPSGEVGNIGFVLKKNDCQSADGASFDDKHLLNRIYLNSVKNGQKWETTLQWVSYLIPNPCKIESSDSESLARDYDKWKERIWPAN